MYIIFVNFGVVFIFCFSFILFLYTTLGREGLLFLQCSRYSCCCCCSCCYCYNCMCKRALNSIFFLFLLFVIVFGYLWLLCMYVGMFEYFLYACKYIMAYVCVCLYVFFLVVLHYTFTCIIDVVAVVVFFTIFLQLLVFLLLLSLYIIFFLQNCLNLMIYKSHSSQLPHTFQVVVRQRQRRFDKTKKKKENKSSTKNLFFVSGLK